MVKLTTNKVIAWAVLVIAIYTILRIVVPPTALLVSLNGVFIGLMLALVIAYYDLIKNSIFAYGHFDRADQFALGLAILWIATALSALSSIYLRSGDNYIPTSTIGYTIAYRYLAIIAAIVQITAPDFGKSIFYGRDRRLMIIAGSTGVLVSIVLIWLQT